MLGSARSLPAFLQFDAYKVFGVVFVACVLVQGWVWTGKWALDHRVFVEGVHRYAAGRPVDHRHSVHQYPATTLLVPAGALAAAGLSDDRALRLTMSFLISLVAALTAAAAFLIRPKTPWWAFVAWLLVFQPLYTLATPPTALLALLAAYFALLVLLARERNAYSLPMLAGIGVCGGAMLATRLDISGVFLAAATLYLASKRAAALLAIPIFALASFFFFDPYLVFSPIEQVSYIIKMIFFHALYLGSTNAIDSIVYSSLFGVVSLVLAGILLSSRRLQSLPPDFALFLMAVSMVITLVLFAGRHHPPWLFYPAYLVWELLLPLIVMDGIRALPEKGTLRAFASPETIGIALAGIYLTYQLWLFYFRVM